jgi:hypothetical protein
VVVTELLEVRQVPGRAQLPRATTRPGRSEASRPTRDDAWMYSAVFFGCPTTSIRPRRCTSTPTCSIEVASTTSNGESLRAAPSCRRLVGGESLTEGLGGVVGGVELETEPVQRLADLG